MAAASYRLRAVWPRGTRSTQISPESYRYQRPAPGAPQRGESIMALKTRRHDPGRKHTGEWPHGEPQTVRDAYDQEEAKKATQRAAEAKTAGGDPKC